jgi:hypothetical protein
MIKDNFGEDIRTTEKRAKAEFQTEKMKLGNRALHQISDGSVPSFEQYKSIREKIDLDKKRATSPIH